MFGGKTHTNQLKPNSNVLFGDHMGGFRFLQPKLEVGKPGDRYEVEADKAADQIVARENTTSFISPAPTIQKQQDDETLQQQNSYEVQHKPVVDSITPVVQLKPVHQPQNQEPIQLKEEEEEELQMKCSQCESEEKIQTKVEEQAQTSESIENQLSASKGGGNPLAEETKSSMESGFGTDFSNVRIHTDSNAVQMNKSIGAQAFTNGNDIYFNEGKYDPNSTSGKHLLAHELTHTIQQGGSTDAAQSKIQMLPDWMNSAAGWVGDKVSGAANSVAKGAAAVGDKVVAGANWVGNKVSSGAEWVGDKISQAGSFVMDGLEGAITSGTSFLNEKWSALKDFGRTAFEEIKQGLEQLSSSVTSPLTMLFSSLSTMSAELLEGAWNLLKSGGATLWNGINAVVQTILQKGESLWSTVSGFVDGIFTKISGFFNNTAFNLLPDVIKKGIRSAYNGLKSLWKNVSSFWKDLWSKLTSYGEEILTAVKGFIDKVIAYGIAKVIAMVRDLREAYDFVEEVFADPRATVMPYLETLANKLGVEGPAKSKELGSQLATENQQDKNSSSGNTIIQRDIIDGKERDTASLSEVLSSSWHYIKRTWNKLDILEVLWTALTDSYYPPNTIKAIESEFMLLFKDDWQEATTALYKPRSFSEDPLGSLHDLWSNCIILLDYPFALVRRLNNSIALLMGYVTVLSVVIGALGGAIAGGFFGYGGGAVPGLFAGASAGLGTASSVGGTLMVSFAGLETSIAVLNFIRVFTVNQTCVKRQIDILSAVASVAGAATAGILNVLMSLFARVATMVVRAFRMGVGSDTAKNITGAATSNVFKTTTGRQAARVKAPSNGRRSTAQEGMKSSPKGKSDSGVTDRPARPTSSEFNGDRGSEMKLPKSNDQSQDAHRPAEQPVPEREQVFVGSNSMETVKKGSEVRRKEDPSSTNKAQKFWIQKADEVTRRDQVDDDNCRIPTNKKKKNEKGNDPKEKKEEELPPTKVHLDWDSEHKRPKTVTADPLTYKEGTEKNSQGSSPYEDPAGWGIVRLFQYYAAFKNTIEGEGDGKEVRVVEDPNETIKKGDDKYKQTRKYANENKFAIYGNTDWVRFHILNEKLHGPGIKKNLLSASGDDNGSYNKQIEEPVKQQVFKGSPKDKKQLKEKEKEHYPAVFHFKASISYQDCPITEDKIHPNASEEEKKTILEQCHMFPEQITIESYRDYKPGETKKLPKTSIVKNPTFTFRSKINMEETPNEKVVVLITSGSSYFTSSAHKRFLATQRGVAHTVQNLANNYMSQKEKRKKRDLINFLKAIVNALNSPKGSEKLTLFYKGVKEVEETQLINLIKDLEGELGEKEKTKGEDEIKFVTMILGTKKVLDKMPVEGNVKKRNGMIRELVKFGKSKLFENGEIATLFNDKKLPDKDGKIGEFSNRTPVIKNTKKPKQ